MNAAESVAERIEADRALYAAAYAQGHADGLAEGLAQGAAHPAVADSVARIFHGWGGAESAHARSVAHFQAWHTAARAHLKEGTDLDHAA
ncbi:hypothetical protein EU554_11625 [Micrococcus luteus]|uniref:hypothetical protein n=1 Tax=Micrococcus luteus TaxID=1270 RepID=UPI00102106FB|nr:hypothetical protein [Micrococcus luteus]RZB21029.1 hypothetical protein EU554_11625 [Micrococcus luteus]